ncbi:MAG TPA: hypothetical protein ENK19_05020, partial [Acidobacteria bacterium]|nr:hypothetical protein [Acidobacteriota bacterium]
MSSHRPQTSEQRSAQPGRLGKLLWPAAAVAFLVEALVLPPAASPFRVPKMSLALAGFALTLILPAALSLWAGTMPRVRSRLVWPILALPVLQLISVAWATDRATA